MGRLNERHSLLGLDDHLKKREPLVGRRFNRDVLISPAKG